MTDREYLRSLGFTVGERGRFSKEMLEALANRAKAETDEQLADWEDGLGLSSPPVPVREPQELYGLTEGGAKVGFIMCSRCADHMMWCECEKILAPDNVAILKGAAKRLAEIHPRMVHLMTTHN